MVVEPLIVGLLLLAALMHASWNAILKSDQSDRLATFGVIMTTGTVMGLCAVPFLPWIEPAAWKYLVASVLIHVLYYTFLLKAYSYGDLSHTYPIARGLGPLLVALVSGRFIGEHLRTQDIVGVLLLSFGLIALAMPLRNVVPRPGSRHGLATLFAVLTGITIAWLAGVGLLLARDLRASAVLHRLALRRGGTVASGAGRRDAPQDGMGASAADMVAWRDRRDHRQYRLWNCDLRVGAWADGPCRGVA